MRAIDRTTMLFVESVRTALPNVQVNVQRSAANHGRSNYVYIHLKGFYRPLKVRISDHAVGMRRALRGDEHLFMAHNAKPSSWAVWVSELPRRAAVLAKDSG